ncbi:flagellar hook-length control protein FliK [Thiomicrospira sp. WB1]|uniref:flagellar hook-length control protein FliK n=1 Tax=Thiomicrospira sp. WB1 TaxID=1685380 RepID=UPI000746477C|nr:flagellar hook-length control protein FliK [Thiomicrospira sp. WB1]KUJ71646.1 hypothetical protein AVO41_09030 [Thiomicrospira sp. WB1]
MMEKTTLNNLLVSAQGADKTDSRQSLPKGASGFAALMNRLAETSDLEMSDIKKGQWLQALKGEASLSDIGLDKEALSQLDLNMDELLSDDMAQNLQAVLQQIEHKMPGVSFKEALSELDLDAETRDWLTSLNDTLAQLNLPGLMPASQEEVGRTPSLESETPEAAIEKVLEKLQALLENTSQHGKADPSAKDHPIENDSNGQLRSLTQSLEKAMEAIEQVLQKIEGQSAASPNKGEGVQVDTEKAKPGIVALQKLADKLEQLAQVVKSAQSGEASQATTSNASSEKPLQVLAERLAALTGTTDGRNSAAQSAEARGTNAERDRASSINGVNPSQLNSDTKLNEEAAKRRQETEAKPTFKVDGRDMKVETTRWAEAKTELKQELRAEMQQAGSSGSGQSGGQSGQNHQSMAQQLAQQQWQQNQQQRQLAQWQQQATKMANEGAVTEEQKAERVEKLLGSLGMDSKNGLPAQLQTLSQPSRSPNWSQALGHRVLYMANHKLQEAKITLNPEKLGSIQVKLNVDKDQMVHVSMVTQQGTTREAIEQAMPKLKEMLENAGMKFGSMDVADERQPASEGKADQESPDQHGLAHSSGAMSDGVDEDNPASAQSILAASNNLVDYYA